METVDTNYLSHFGYTKDQILAENDIEFSSVDDMYNEHEELNLGDIMSDAYVYAVENSEYYDGDPVDVAVVPSGTVRDIPFTTLFRSSKISPTSSPAASSSVYPLPGLWQATPQSFWPTSPPAHWTPTPAARSSPS